MYGSSGRGRVLVATAAFLAAYAGVVTLVTGANNGWYPVLSSGFCGSPADFTRDPVVPAVCLAVEDYWVRVAVHPPYALLAAAASAVVAGAVAFRDAIGDRVP